MLLRKKKKKKGKKFCWFENRDEKTTGRRRFQRRSAFSAKKSNRRDLLVFFGLFWSFRQGLFDFSKTTALEKTLRTHEERDDDDDDCIMGAPASETPCTLRGATTGWSSSFDWSRRRPCSSSGECKIFVFLCCASVRTRNWRELDKEQRFVNSKIFRRRRGRRSRIRTRERDDAEKHAVVVGLRRREKERKKERERDFARARVPSVS